MRKSVLYYASFYEGPEYKKPAYAVAYYSDGSARYWYPKDRGFKSAFAKGNRRSNFLWFKK
jgi:hypothetical protein